MAQIVGVVAAQIAMDKAEEMLQKQGQKQSQNQDQNKSPGDDQGVSMSAPSGGMFSPDAAMQFASSMLPKNLDSILQKKGSGGKSQSLLNEGEELLNQGIQTGMSFVKK
ncbi:hypothetical protein [Legionella resiliens]|uniref:Uncharacterized protein n=1 Tax=Legionella resiliens TaxID=2905958 RepID=A0ABS8WZR5_9GAMM|nr:MULTISPECIES: hypothetical protein [unclassified Legionella]MCE0721857.1 hypothetical protein [Legionella sp. 9fVS26]MCE3531011.1 hypothetical protein [Legionella sp. 8cVS16]